VFKHCENTVDTVIFFKPWRQTFCTVTGTHSQSVRNKSETCHDASGSALTVNHMSVCVCVSIELPDMQVFMTFSVPRLK